MKEFFEMGGYAVYVWTSYGIVAAVMYGNVIAARLQRKQILQEIQDSADEQM
jgi:heme exporter protein D